MDVSVAYHCDHLSLLLFIIYKWCIQKIKHSKLLIFANDIKLIKRIKCDEGFFLLQNDLNIFVDWCNSSEILLNTNKCTTISFSLKKNKVCYNYVIVCFFLLFLYLLNKKCYITHYNITKFF